MRVPDKSLLSGNPGMVHPELAPSPQGQKQYTELHVINLGNYLSALPGASAGDKGKEKEHCRDREFAKKSVASPASPNYVKLQRMIKSAASTGSPGRLRCEPT